MSELQTFFEKLYFVSTYTLIIPILVYVFLWHKIKVQLYKLVFLKILIQFTILFLGSWMVENKLNTHLLFYLSPIFDIILLSTIFGKTINESWLNKTLLIISTLFFIGFTYNFFFLKGENFMSANLGTAETFTVVVLIVYYLYWLIYIKQKTNLKRNGMFWIAISYLFSNLLALSYTLFATTLEKNAPELFNFITIAFYPIFSIICDLLIAYGFYIAAKYRK